MVMAEIAIEIAAEVGVKALKKVLEHISSMVKQEISQMQSLDKDIDFLRENLPLVKELMLNAQALILNEDMSTQSSLLVNLKVFVKGLKQFVYNGEDIIDEFDLQIRRRQINKRKIACKLKKLYTEFEELTEKNQNAEKFLKFLKDNLRVLGDEVGNRLPLWRKSSISMIQRKDFKMVGRDEDKKRLLHNLLENKLEPSVLLLTGLGGIGKTTFAHDILHDPQIVSHFAFRKWVTVGDRNLDPTKVLIQMLDKIVDTLIEVSAKVRSVLEKKKFFIVLDDVWKGKDLNHHWNDLWAPLSHGSEGSRVIVTTREKDVKDSMEGLRVHVETLGLLSNEGCQKIFEAFAFPDGFDIPSSSSSPTPPIHLREIGKQIVNKKVKGVPLAARVIGSSLRDKEDMHWNAALTQIKERDMNSVILWSYLNLSMHLKQCFVYCSLFPKDTHLDKTKIVRLWMAHSFVIKSSSQHNDVMTLVEIGESYFDALVNASLIQEEEFHYKMHDLIHDFALKILGDEFSKGKDSMKSLRHLIIEKNDQALPQNHSDIKNLHTFMSKDPLHVNNFTRDQLKTVKYLSITGGYSDVSKTFITELFQKLSQVRYLDISGIEISTLPVSVYNMCALQTLILDDDTIQFPKKMSKKLVELHHIEARDNVSRIRRLGQLKKLHSIGGRFILHEDNGHCIKELRNLEQLRGKLEIKGFGHVQQLIFKEQLLENHEHLEELVLDMDGDTKSEVLNYLQPHGNLKALKIKNYGMVQLPSWLGNKDFNIVLLELSHCSVEKLPPLGCLPRLKNLNMENFDKIEQIGEEFYGSGIDVFPSLKKLVLNKMDMLHEWKELAAVSGDKNSMSYFPSLKELKIYSCRSLQALPKELPPSLKRLDIISCNNLRSLPKELPSSLEYLWIVSCNSLQALPNELPSSLEYLGIDSCNSLLTLPKKLPSSLEYLVINSCDNLGTLPNELPPSLRKVIIEDCPLLPPISEK